MRLLCQCRVCTGRGLIRQHCDESHHQGGQASNQVCTKTPNRRRRQHRTARFEDTQVSGEMSHDAAADTSLAPLPGRARHTHSGVAGRTGTSCRRRCAPRCGPRTCRARRSPRPRPRSMWQSPAKCRAGSTTTIRCYSDVNPGRGELRMNGSDVAAVLSSYAGVCAGSALIVWSWAWLTKKIVQCPLWCSRRSGHGGRPSAHDAPTTSTPLKAPPSNDLVTAAVALVWAAALIVAAFTVEEAQAVRQALLFFVVIGVVVGVSSGWRDRKKPHG